MAEPEPTTEETPPNPDEVDLEELIGGVLEARGFTVDRASKLDLLDSLGDTFGSKLEELLTKLQPGTPAPASGGSSEGLDVDGLLSKVGEMIDSKLAGIAPGTPAATKKPPLMQRMLGVKGV